MHNVTCYVFVAINFMCKFANEPSEKVIIDRLHLHNSARTYCCTTNYLIT